MDTIEEIPHVLLYWGLEMERQCSLSCLKGRNCGTSGGCWSSLGSSGTLSTPCPILCTTASQPIQKLLICQLIQQNLYSHSIIEYKPALLSFCINKYPYGYFSQGLRVLFLLRCLIGIVVLIFQQIITGRSMVQIEFIKNTFDKSNTKKIYDVLELVSFNQPTPKIIQDIQTLSPKEYLWAIASNPAYFVQYQVNSAAILKVKDLILLVWKPKYIQYPTMIVFPSFSDKKLKSLKLQIDVCTTTTQYTNERLLQYLQSFYGTYFHSDPQFQTNLVTFAKHFISKVSNHCYWHALYEETDRLFLTQQENMDNIIKIQVSGIKEGYNKTLFLFSLKGKRSNIFVTAKSKWMQLVSFLAMAMIFYAVVACPSSSVQNGQGFCEYKSEITLFGGGLMLALIGLRYSAKKEKKGRVKGDKQKIN